VSTYGCIVSEKNSRNSSRVSHSPRSSPGKLFTKACPCCVESSPTVRKRLIDDLNDDTVKDCKRMRRSMDRGSRLCERSRVCVREENEVCKTDSSSDRNPTTTEVVKRRGRPCRVSCLLVVVQFLVMFVSTLRMEYTVE